jgi:type II secretory pathway pseudopilin PulG
MGSFAKARKSTIRPHGNEDGYVLLTMLLVVSLMAIAATAVLPAMSYQIKRDQEQEMIHRGVQYSRAIRTYYKKFGRYPTRLEDLDNTNNLRYLRKHYKDPITGKDFRLLHYGEQGVTLAGGIAGGSIPGANPIGAQGGLNGSQGNNSSFGGSGFGGSGFGGSSSSGFGNSFGGSSGSGVNSNGVFAQSPSSSFGGNSNGGFGANSNSQGTAGQSGANGTPGSDPSQPSPQVKGTGQGDDSSSSQQLVTGGPIVGVASTSKNTGLHEYNHKKKFNEWQFVYDPTTDRGGLITTPNQPSLAGFGSAPNLNGQPGAQGTNGFGGQSSSGQSSFGQSSFGQSSFGQSGQSSFGQPSSGFNNNNNQGPMSPPAQPPSTPPQQQ